MLIEILLALLVGIFIGTLTGLIPGIHINLAASFILALSIKMSNSIEPIYLIVIIVSASITHTFIDFIPSVFLGCPDTDTELSILPGHKLLKQGLGYEAIILSAYGGLASIFFLIILIYPSIKFMDIFYKTIKNFIPFILILVSILLILNEKNKLRSFFVFLITGILGLIALSNDSINQPLLPLLTGLFGASSIIISIKNKTKIPSQKITKIKKPLKIVKKPLIGSFIASPLCSFLPGLGSGQAALIGNLISKTNEKGFLVLIGATNTLVMGFSFVCLYIISKTRTGSAAAIKELINPISKEIFILIMATIIITGIVSFFITKKIAKIAIKIIKKIEYGKLSRIVLITLILLVLLISGLEGLVILIVSTMTGYYCINQKVKRTNMMGCLIIPTILLYLI